VHLILDGNLLAKSDAWFPMLPPNIRHNLAKLLPHDLDRLVAVAVSAPISEAEPAEFPAAMMARHVVASAVLFDPHEAKWALL